MNAAPIPFFPALGAWLVAVVRLCVAWMAYRYALLFDNQKKGTREQT